MRANLDDHALTDPRFWRLGQLLSRHSETDPNPTTNSGLWVLAPSVSSAEKKARAVLKKEGQRKVQIQAVTHNGTIDAF